MLVSCSVDVCRLFCGWLIGRFAVPYLCLSVAKTDHAVVLFVASQHRKIIYLSIYHVWLFFFQIEICISPCDCLDCANYFSYYFSYNHWRWMAKSSLALTFYLFSLLASIWVNLMLIWKHQNLCRILNNFHSIWPNKKLLQAKCFHSWRHSCRLFIMLPRLSIGTSVEGKAFPASFHMSPAVTCCVFIPFLHSIKRKKDSLSLLHAWRN